MKNYSICIIGLGSIGRRHLNNIKTVLSDRNCSWTVDALRSGVKRESVHPEGVLRRVCYDPKEMDDHYDVIIIANPTIYHHETLMKFRDRAKAFFIEKPVFDSYHDSLDAFDGKRHIAYVACPMRYTGIIDYLKKNIKREDVLSVRAVSSSYLPDWRPGQDYRKTYSAQKKMGGGVAKDVIHEWDYLTYLFGFPKRVVRETGKISPLEIDSEDIASYIGIYSDKIIELHLDYYSKVINRNLEITTCDDTIKADFVKNRITYESDKKTISFPEERNELYLREMNTFFDIIEGKSGNENDLEHAIRVLALAEGVVL